jgi:guanine deaminase
VLSAIRQASIVSKVLAIQERDYELSFEQTFTRGRSMTPNARAALVPTLHESQSTPTLADSIANKNNPSSARKSTLKPTTLGSVSYPPNNFFSSRHLSIPTLFYLGTMGGAELCCLQDRIGNFIVGKEFDALWIQTGQSFTAQDLFPKVGEEEEDEEKILDSIPDQFAAHWNPNMFVDVDDNLEKVFEKWVFVGDDRNIGTVWVRGRVIGGARPVIQVNA